MVSTADAGMNQDFIERASESTPVLLNESLIQQELSTRQAKRAAKAAERREKSNALKEEGNAFFRSGDFMEALDRYQRAVDVHGPSAQPVLLTNLAATYLKLGMYSEAHDAAERALVADPRSVKARYRRGVARQHMKVLSAAEIDFRTVLRLDPDNDEARVALASVVADRGREDEDATGYSDWEAPGVDQDPEVCASLSESSDCEHAGNGIPCKFYNRTTCRNGRDCRYSHAPDQKSERDALGRNVCWYYLIGACKFGERCSYSHSKEHLLHRGWWSTSEGVDKERRRYNLLQMCNKAIADQDKQNKASKGRKKQAMVRKNDNRSRSGRQNARSGPSSQGLPPRRKKPLVQMYSDLGYDSDSDSDSDDMFGMGMCGFTGSQVAELMSQGVKPWDNDAWDVMHAIHDYY